MSEHDSAPSGARRRGRRTLPTARPGSSRFPAVEPNGRTAARGRPAWWGPAGHAPDGGAPDGGVPAGGPRQDDAVWRLRSRACWTEAAELLAASAARDPWAALRRAGLLIEQCLFTGAGWDVAEAALRQAEAAARSDEQRAAAACERGFLAYTCTLMRVRDRSDEAQAALGRTSALLPPDAPGRPLLDFRRGLLSENLLHEPAAARTAYRRAHAGALRRGDDLLCSHTSRHLAGLALREGDVAAAREGFTTSLRLRERLGFTVGVAPALASLADASPPAKAVRLRAEAARLVTALGGVPVWLVDRLGPDGEGTARVADPAG